MAISGRHGFSSYRGRRQNGLQIDLSALSAIHINADNDTVTVGPGVQFKDILEPLYDAGRETTFGVCSTVSLISATLGTGVGRYQKLHGLLTDQLLS